MSITNVTASEIGSSFAQGKMPNNFQGVGKSQFTEFSQPLSTSIHGGSSVSRPSSNYSSRSQQISGGQKGRTLVDYFPSFISLFFVA